MAEEENKVDVVVHLQQILNKCAKAGVFETTAEATLAQTCLNALTQRLEELTLQVRQLSAKTGSIPPAKKTSKRK